MKNKVNENIKRIKNSHFWSNLFKNSFWAFTGDTIASLLGLVVSIILIKILGSDVYGILILAQTYMQIMDVIINIQSWKSVIQYGQKAIVEKNIDLLHSYIKLGTVLDISTALLCTLCAFFIAPIIGNIFRWSSELVLCCQIFSLTVITHFAGTPTAILRILDKFSLVALQKFISSVIKVGTLIFIFYTGTLTLVQATIVYAITDALGNILLVIFAFSVYSKKYGLKGIFKAKLPLDSKEFISFTLWGTLSEIVDIPVNYLDVFIISLLGNEMVSIFKVFKQLAGIFQKITSPIQQSILPQFSQLSAEGMKKRGYDVVIRIRNFVLKAVLPIAVIVGLTSKIWLNILYGADYAMYWYVLLIYMCVQVFALSYTTIHPYYLSLGHAKRSGLYVFVANCVYCIVAFYLVQCIGMLGIILAYVCQFTIVIYFKSHHIKKTLEVK